jgi:uncharacterized membrane protein (UPF0127 family)
MRQRRHFDGPLIWLLLAFAGISAAGGADELPGFTRATIEVRSSQGRQWFKVYLARTPQQQERGLMFVQQLPEDTGMLFPQHPLRRMSMWMKNTLISLDMLFIDQRGRIVCLHEHVAPQSLDIIDCPVPVQAVLEINAGQAASRGIRRGDSVDLHHASLQQ